MNKYLASELFCIEEKTSFFPLNLKFALNSKIPKSEFNGTFGLKLGFKLAGVEQIIVSLWSVPDKETMELMTLFYSDLTKTLNPIISFEKAQKEMRNKYPTEPDKWAGFVLVR
jgi:CHAT domain-containing protein